MRRTKEDAAQTCQTLLDAALQIFSQKGYRATRLDDIVQNAGVTQGAFYHHFKGKTAVYTQLIQAAIAQLDAVIEEAIVAGGTLEEIGVRVFVDGLSLLETDRRYRETMALLYGPTTVPAELTELNQFLRQNNVAQVERIRHYMQQAIDAGELRPAIDPEMAAHAFMAYYSGLSAQWLANQALFSIETAVSPLAEIFMHGVIA